MLECFVNSAPEDHFDFFNEPPLKVTFGYSAPKSARSLFWYPEVAFL